MFDEILEQLHDRLERGEITEDEWKEQLHKLEEDDW